MEHDRIQGCCAKNRLAYRLAGTKYMQSAHKWAWWGAALVGTAALVFHSGCGSNGGGDLDASVGSDGSPFGDGGSCKSAADCDGGVCVSGMCW